MKKDIFDLLKVNDLPPAMAERVKGSSLTRYDMRILSLFDIKKLLTSTEVMVGLYRQYGLARSIQSIHVALHKLKKDGFLKSVRRGVYAKV